MEIRLIKIIFVLDMILTFIFGIILLYQEEGLIWEKYFIIKLCLVLLLVIYQIYLIHIFKIFKVLNNTKSKNFYEVLNEIPTNLMIIIILLVVLKSNIG